MVSFRDQMFGIMNTSLVNSGRLRIRNLSQDSYRLLYYLYDRILLSNILYIICRTNGGVRANMF